MGVPKKLTNSVDLIERFCKKCNVKPIKKLSFLLGSNLGPTKTLLRDYTLNQCFLYEKWTNNNFNDKNEINHFRNIVLNAKSKCNDKSIHGIPILPPNPFNIIAIDIGLSNFSYAKIQIDLNNPKIPPTLTMWGKLDLFAKYRKHFYPKLSREMFESMYYSEDVLEKIKNTENGVKDNELCENEQHSGKTEEGEGANLLDNLDKKNPKRKSKLKEKTLRKYRNSKLAPKFNPSIITSVCNDLADFLVPNESEYAHTGIVVESQRIRTGGSSQVLQPVYRNSVFEYVLTSTLENRFKPTISVPNHWEYTNKNSIVHGSNAQKMVNYWLKICTGNTLSVDQSPAQKHFTTEEDLKSEEISSKLKRKTFVWNILKKSVLEENKVSFSVPDDVILPFLNISEQLRDQMFDNDVESFGNVAVKARKSLFDLLKLDIPTAGTRKDDDLADSLLHCLAWSQWFRTYRLLAITIVGKSFLVQKEIDDLEKLLIDNFNCFLEYSKDMVPLSKKIKKENSS
ncbi:cruciform cutting endonuclease SCDLUD_003090 [Saccharomycodes ludwigii]|uniref:cruciform cutting endonuclease n=1 Tax=Saccharomycodes ludwigii TaxID=36035 RepID=UPI001E85E232|nr:hypothetical protein SCDLUD_003090 [Saccharomycodes ludwigii]KAH3900122.1 hypothetical protein SCDLUD_003090 [Saccharomycodes ludwigii]